MRMALERSGFDVVADAEDGEEAIVVAGEHKPDLILLDLHMPGLGGLEALPRILRASPRSRVVVFSAMAATRMLEAAFDAGASGYIVKGVSPKRIAEHLHRVAKSGSVRPVQPWPLAGG
jgi:DNA-binding NarL/FixJ family response regulator